MKKRKPIMSGVVDTIDSAILKQTPLSFTLILLSFNWRNGELWMKNGHTNVKIKRQNQALWSDLAIWVTRKTSQQKSTPEKISTRNFARKSGSSAHLGSFGFSSTAFWIA